MSDEEVERLNQACYELDRSASDIIRSAIENYIDRHCKLGTTVLEDNDARVD